MSYAKLEERFKRIAALRDAQGVLQWDQAVMMPPGGALARGEQTAALEAARHALLVAPEVGDWLAAAEAAPEADPWRAANLVEMRRAWRHATAVPADLVEALAKACAACETAWRSARAEADFPRVRPLFARVLDRVRDMASAKAAALGCAPYDALLDQYEPSGRIADIERLFAELAGFLPALADRVIAAQAQQPQPPEAPPVSPERQRALAERLMGILGFDFKHGRLDTSLHPFCGGNPEDVRITTRYDANDFSQGLLSVLHETGHALYERGLPAAWRGQPVGEARGMSLHESQSLLHEMQVGRSRGFLSFLAPLLAEFFGDHPAWRPEALFRRFTRVRKDFIRVNADELTYPAHVILRTRLERAMIGGELSPADLPGAWNDGMRELLGIVPPTDREGCLQDIHWYDGAWGYFPTYTLGALTAAQLFAAAKTVDSDIEPALSKGDFGPLAYWLAVHVHGRASRLGATELLIEATGQPLGVGPFRRHLEARYLSPD